MRVVAFNGSPRRGGNTSRLLQMVLNELEIEGIKTELIEMAGVRLRGCMACFVCKEQKNGRCVIQDDPLNEWLKKMFEADGVLLGSPTYFSNVTSEMKALIDRAGIVARANGDLLKGKAAAAVVAVRRAGALPTFDAMNHFFLIEQMIVVGSSYWNLGVGRAEGEVEDDAEGVETMQTLGRNMAWLLKKIHRP